MATATKKPVRPATAAAKKTPKAARPRPSRKAAGGSGAVAAPKRSEPAPAPVPAKAPKVKLVRDSFTIPRDEYAAIEALKLRAAKLGRIAKKSELLRAGLKLLAACADAGLLGALEAVPPVKTGRPKGKHRAKEGSAGGDAATTASAG